MLKSVFNRSRKLFLQNFKPDYFYFLIQEGRGHLGSKPAQAVYLKDGKVFTTGFSRMSEREYALWDEVI